MTPFDQRSADCRCEWGALGLDALARGSESDSLPGSWEDVLAVGVRYDSR